MNPCTIGLIAFAVILIAGVFLATYLMDRCAAMRSERDTALIDNARLRDLVRQRGGEPPPPLGSGHR